ncbi:hypothetical protein [Methylosarcina fibrata]|uniref:hypothetical protein n=1 Tax=Methylosarcina fibrata TaxID=105972 RepID=UPI00039A7534|nr:hypothetical protein [Methylosarcina fibrata]
MQVEIDDKTIQRLKQLFPGRLASVMNTTDVSFFTDFMAGLGIDTVNAVLEKNPDLTFGDLITRYSSRH